MSLNIQKRRVGADVIVLELAESRWDSSARKWSGRSKIC
jgi:hypothetical protein